MGRYLVTGGAGFIGSHLCEALLEAGHQVVVLDDFSSGKRTNLAGMDNRLEVTEGDISAGALRQIKGEFDGVIHLAALISGHDSLHDATSYLRVNVSGTMDVIAFIAERRIPRIVFASSSTVYGNSESSLIDEGQVPSPITVYAASKLMGEHLLSMYGSLHGFTHCSLRFFNVYGPRQSLDHPYANVTCKFSHAAAHEASITLYGDGEQTRDFVYVADVVRSLMLVLSHSPSPVYNIGTGKETSINQLIGALETITGRSLPIESKAGWPNDIRRIAADLSRAKTEIGYSSSFSISEGLEKTVRAFRSA